MNKSQKNFTQGGQVVFYMIRMFIQVNKVIFKWFIIFFALISTVLFFIFNIKKLLILKMAFYYYLAKLYHYADPNSSISFTLEQYAINVKAIDVLNNSNFIKAKDYLLDQLLIHSSISFVICFIFYLIVYFYLINKGKKQSEDDFITGRKLEKNPKEVAKTIKKQKLDSDIVLGGLPIIKNSEIQNFLAHGTLGTGKSTLIVEAIEYIKKRGFKKGDKIIIYDKGCSIMPRFYDDKNDYILNPLDERCANWNMWDECKSKADFDNFASSLIPAQANGDPFWYTASRTLFSALAYEMRDKKPTYKEFLRNLLAVDVYKLKEILKDTEAENLTDAKAEKTTISIRNVLTTYVKSMTYLQGLNDTNNKKLNFQKWLEDEEDHGVIYLTSNKHHETIKPLISAWLSTMMNSLFGLGENRNRRVWFFVDELPSLQKLPFLLPALAEGRKFGSCFFVGVQNLQQLEDLYGVKSAQATIDLLNTKYFFRSPSVDVAKRVSEQIGKAKHNVFNEQYSYGLQEVRDGVSFSKKEEHKEIVTADEIMVLPDLQCYVTYPVDIPATILKLKYKPYEPKAIGFIERNFDSSLKVDKNTLDILKENLKKNNAANNKKDESEEADSEITDNPTDEIKFYEKPKENGQKKGVKKSKNNSDIFMNEENNINHSNFEHFEL